MKQISMEKSQSVGLNKILEGRNFFSGQFIFLYLVLISKQNLHSYLALLRIITGDKAFQTRYSRHKSSRIFMIGECKVIILAISFCLNSIILILYRNFSKNCPQIIFLT